MSKGDDKQIKNMAKKAKERLKNGFWEDYRENVEEAANDNDANKSTIINYYRTKALRELDGDNDQFYQKVKNILDTVGDVGDMIGRLCDDEYLKSLCYVQQERYIFELSNRYLECKERYYEEKKFEEYIKRIKKKSN